VSPATLRRAVPAAAAIALALAGAACGGDGGAEARGRPESLEEALGLGQEDVQAREAKVQEAVRRCMQEQGFEYVPMDTSQLNVRIVGRGGIGGPADRATRGYGITTGDDGPVAPGGNGPDDPNQAIRQALSEADRAAYDRALFGRTADAHVGDNGSAGGFVFSPGVPVAGGPGGGEVGEAAEPATPVDPGCFGRAQAEVGGSSLQRIAPELQELQELIDADPRLVRVNAEWSRCMADAGYSFDTPDEIVRHLFRRLQEATGGGPPGSPVIRTPGAGLTPELAELQREERAIAAADDACAEQTGRTELAERVRAEAERQFLEDNPDLGRGAGEG
jgi:hypothetical protein